MINGFAKAVISRSPTVAYVVVNWVSGPAADGLFLAATTAPQLQSLTPNDTVDVYVEPERGFCETTFDGTTTLTESGKLPFAGVDVLVNRLVLQTLRVRQRPASNVTLIEISDGASGPELSIRADGMVIADVPLTVGDHVRIQLHGVIGQARSNAV